MLEDLFTYYFFLIFHNVLYVNIIHSTEIKPPYLNLVQNGKICWYIKVLLCKETLIQFTSHDILKMALSEYILY